jgi:uncharacterized damage-inducible protein DinB
VQETPQQYIQRMLARVTGKDALKIQASSAARLARLIRNVPPVKLRKRPAPEKWSVAEILAHLADTEFAIGFRLRSILGTPGCPTAAFNQDAWASGMDYSRRKVRESIDDFRAVRKANLDLLNHIRPEQWKDYGMHSERGQETIEHIVRLIAGHDLNHIAQVEAILKPAKK